jgi:hypothetical protein
MFRAQTDVSPAYIWARAWNYMSAEQGSAVTLSTSAVMVALGQCNGFAWCPSLPFLSRDILRQQAWYSLSISWINYIDHTL